MFTPVPDENSMEDPLCNSSFGSMVSLDHVAPDTEDGENATQEGDQRIVDLALQAVYKGTRKGTWGFGKGQSLNER